MSTTLPLAPAAHLMTVDHQDDLDEYRAVVRRDLRTTVIVDEDQLADYLGRAGNYKAPRRACRFVWCGTRRRLHGAARPICGTSRTAWARPGSCATRTPYGILNLRVRSAPKNRQSPATARGFVMSQLGHTAHTRASPPAP
jgi:hypothetical protein